MLSVCLHSKTAAFTAQVGRESKAQCLLQSISCSMPFATAKTLAVLCSHSCGAPLYSNEDFWVLDLTSSNPSFYVIPKICCRLIVYTVFMLHFSFSMFLSM